MCSTHMSGGFYGKRPKMACYGGNKAFVSVGLVKILLGLGQVHMRGLS